MTMLDPKFAKVVALMRSSEHAGEKDSARARAEGIAAAAGMTFDEALAAIDTPRPAASPFAGFDDFMEREEPGWKAKKAAEQAARREVNAAKRAAVIAKYGSEELALAPCERERLILAAVAQWRKPCKAPHQRWTNALDGWTGTGHWTERKKMPPQVLSAITNAYPLPTTFPEARAEHEYWQLRNYELDLLLDRSGLGLGDIVLDMPASVRAEIIRDLVEKDLPVTSIEDLHARFSIYRNVESHNDDIEAALFRDLSVIVERRHLSADLSKSGPKPSGHPSATADRDGQIRAALDSEPSRSDRDIARACNCSPTTVGKARRAMGLSGTARSVHRGEQIYSMRAPSSQTSANRSEAVTRHAVSSRVPNPPSAAC